MRAKGRRQCLRLFFGDALPKRQGKSDHGVLAPARGRCGWAAVEGPANPPAPAPDNKPVAIQRAKQVVPAAGRLLGIKEASCTVLHTRRGEAWGFGVDKWAQANHRKAFRAWCFFVHARMGFSTPCVESDGGLLWTTRCERYAARVFSGGQELSTVFAGGCAGVPASGRHYRGGGFPHGAWKAMGVCCGQVGWKRTRQGFPGVIN